MAKLLRPNDLTRTDPSHKHSTPDVIRAHKHEDGKTYLVECETEGCFFESPAEHIESTLTFI